MGSYRLLSVVCVTALLFSCGCGEAKTDPEEISKPAASFERKEQTVDLDSKRATQVSQTEATPGATRTVDIVVNTGETVELALLLRAKDPKVDVESRVQAAKAMDDCAIENLTFHLLAMLIKDLHVRVDLEFVNKLRVLGAIGDADTADALEALLRLPIEWGKASKHLVLTIKQIRRKPDAK